jgi:PST family polysaccharide transporter
MIRPESTAVDPERHIRLDAIHSKIRECPVHSGFIRIGGQGIQIILALVSGMVLARLLTPEDFGLFALVNSLIALVNTFRDFGLRMATVHQETINHQQVSAIFWLNLKLNFLVVLFIILMAPVIAWFYSDARLTAITFILAIGIFGLNLSTQHESLLIRQMRFSTLTFIELGSMFIGIAVGIGLSLLEFGYWALVYQLFVTNLTKSAAIWLFCGWTPTKFSSFSVPSPDIRSLLSYGGHYTGFKVLTHLSQKLDVILLGYVGGANGVGLYQNAFRWAFFPLQQLYAPLLSVAVSGLSRRQNDTVAYRNAIKKGLLPVLSVIMPVLLFMFVEAQSVILLLLGNQWLEAVPLFRLLSLAAFATSMSRVTKWLYLSQGETRRQFQWGLVSSPFMVLALVIGVQWGAYGVATSFTVATYFLMFPELAFCLSRSHLSGRDFLSIIWRPVVASMMATAFLFFVSSAVLPESGIMIVELLVKLLLFSIVYLLLWVVLPGGRQAIKDVWQLLVVLREKDTDE